MPGKNFTPFPVLKTERLTLRQLESNDAKEILALRSHKEVNKYLNRKPGQTIDDAISFIKLISVNTQKNDSIYWAITLNTSDKLIGTICLFDFSEDNLKAEIGYELLPDFQRKGLMQEAISKVLDFGMFHIGLNSIEAYTHVENRSSTRILEKLKFKMRGALDENIVIFQLVSND